MNKKYEVLENFNFSEAEINIYLAILSLNKPGVSEVAKKIEMKRTAVYFHIKNLLAKNIIKETRQKKKLCFIAVAPSDLAKKFDNWTNDFKNLVPQLESLKKFETETPTFELTESKRGYFNIYNELTSLPPGSIYRVAEGTMAMRQEMRLLTQNEWTNFFSKIVEKKIETKGIFSDESLQVVSQELNTQNQNLLNQRIVHAKTFPEQIFPLKDFFLIYGDKVAFLFPTSSLVLIIKHRGIAEAMTTFFDTMFYLGKPHKF